VPTFALNFYSPVVADQLRTGRKTVTIRLGDKSMKYRKGMIVTVLVGARYGQREKVFDAVIDKVEVKPLADLSPREIEHDNPEIRRLDEFTEWLSRLYNRPVAEADTITVIKFSQIVGTMFLDVGEPMVPPRAPSFCAANTDAAPGLPAGKAGLRPRPDYRPGRLIAPPKRSLGRSGAPQSSHSTWNAEGIRASQVGQRATSAVEHCGQTVGRSSSWSSKYRTTCPHDGQNATQSPSVLRRSSWIQFRRGAIASTVQVALLPSG
jgi:hypothetical protein